MLISFSETHTNTLCSRQFKTINTMISSFQRTKSHPLGCLRVIPSKLNKVSCVQVSVRLSVCFLRKEVIQPQVLLRLPCYDFTLWFNISNSIDSRRFLFSNKTVSNRSTFLTFFRILYKRTNNRSRRQLFLDDQWFTLQHLLHLSFLLRNQLKR